MNYAAIEQFLINEFKSVKGIPDTSVSPWDTLRCLGADSLNTAQFFGRISQKKPDWRGIPSAGNMINMTLEEIAYAIAIENANIPTPRLSNLKSGETPQPVPADKPRIFFLPGLFGNADGDFSSFKDLAGDNALNNYELIGISAREKTPIPSVGLCALDYINAIEAYIPSAADRYAEPVRLVGWSSGGNIAKAMAKKLREKRHYVICILLDAPSAKFFSEQSTQNYIAYLQNLFNRMKLPLISRGRNEQDKKTILENAFNDGLEDALNNAEGFDQANLWEIRLARSFAMAVHNYHYEPLRERANNGSDFYFRAQREGFYYDYRGQGSEIESNHMQIVSAVMTNHLFGKISEGNSNFIAEKARKAFVRIADAIQGMTPELEFTSRLEDAEVSYCLADTTLRNQAGYNPINTVLKPGEKLRIVGPVGVGRTTFLKLLAKHLARKGKTPIYMDMKKIPENRRNLQEVVTEYLNTHHAGHGVSADFELSQNQQNVVLLLDNVDKSHIHRRINLNTLASFSIAATTITDRAVTGVDNALLIQLQGFTQLGIQKYLEGTVTTHVPKNILGNVLGFAQAYFTTAKLARNPKFLAELRGNPEFTRRVRNGITLSVFCSAYIDERIRAAIKDPGSDDTDDQDLERRVEVEKDYVISELKKISDSFFEEDISDFGPGNLWFSYFSSIDWDRLKKSKIIERVNVDDNNPRYNFALPEMRSFFRARSLYGKFRKNPTSVAEFLIEHRYKRQDFVTFIFLAGLIAKKSAVQVDTFVELLAEKPRDLFLFYDFKLLAACLNEVLDSLQGQRGPRLSQMVLRVQGFAQNALNSKSAYIRQVMRKEVDKNKRLFDTAFNGRAATNLQALADTDPVANETAKSYSKNLDRSQLFENIMTTVHSCDINSVNGLIYMLLASIPVERAHTYEPLYKYTGFYGFYWASTASIPRLVMRGNGQQLERETWQLWIKKGNHSDHSYPGDPKKERQSSPGVWQMIRAHLRDELGLDNHWLVLPPLGLQQAVERPAVTQYQEARAAEDTPLISASKQIDRAGGSRPSQRL